jgi:hypothetical protein
MGGLVSGITPETIKEAMLQTENDIITIYDQDSANKSSPIDMETVPITAAEKITILKYPFVAGVAMRMQQMVYFWVKIPSISHLIFY